MRTRFPSRWRARCPQTATAALVGTAGFVFWPVVSKLLFDWWNDPDYTHGLLVAPAALWMTWRRRHELLRADSAPRAEGLLLVLLALALLIVGTLGAELFLTRVSLLLFVAGSVVFLRGWVALRLLAFPSALIALTIPIPAIIAGHATLSLQLAASRMAEDLLSALAVPVLRDGNVLMLPRATLQVADACSGIRSLAALVTLALVVGRASVQRWIPRLAIVVSAIPIAVLVNGIRVTTTALATQELGQAAATGLIHELFGLAMFGLAVGCLAATARGVASLGRLTQRTAS